MAEDQKGGKKEKVYFRDMLHTVDEAGKRKWIYAKRPKGRLYNFRWLAAIILLTLFFSMPFIRVNGEQFLLLNIFERKFILFGHVFWPQDFHLVVLMIIALLIFVILFTVTYGRLFCGWACPQTIFMEFIFRQIEFLIDGDVAKQKKLARQSWNFGKIWKRGLKHGIYILISITFMIFFLTYLIGMEGVKSVIREGFAEHTSTYIAVFAFSGAFYFVFSWFREQVCMLVCPYGRLQGVLLDERSVVVAYNYRRGEPRKGSDALKADDATEPLQQGDCIDCYQCVAVCPTGIDIRNGTQLECVNCTACIDACNYVMDKEKLPRSLIGYYSERNLSTGIRKVFNPRSVAYSVLLLMLIGLIIGLFAYRSAVEVTILRVPGTLYQNYGTDRYSNIYTIQLVNKTRQNMPIELTLTDSKGEIVMIGEGINALVGKVTEASFMVVIQKNDLESSKTPLRINVWSEGKQITGFNTSFVGPNSLDKNHKP